jgi:hypothetical protein
MSLAPEAARLTEIGVWHGRPEPAARPHRETGGDAIYWLKDFASSLSIPPIVRPSRLFETSPRNEPRATEGILVVFFVDLPTPAERQAISEIHLRIRNQDPAKFDPAQLVTASDGFSGAEIEQCVITAMYGALRKNTALSSQLLLAGLEATVRCRLAAGPISKRFAPERETS